MGLSVIVAATSWLAACGPAVSAIEPDAPPDHGLGSPECKLARKEARPLVVEWPVVKRGRLEAALRKGPVVVSVEGCEIEPLWDCKAPGEYEYAGLTRKNDVVRIRNADELYGQLPVGAASLEAKLARKGEIHVSLAVVGRYETKEAVVEAEKLEGSCKGATHIVSGVSMGAFELAAATGAAASGGVQAFGAEVGGKSEREREVLSSDGQVAACETSSSDDEAPPEGCGATLRIDITPLAAAFDWEALRVAVWEAEQKILQQCVMKDEFEGTTTAFARAKPDGTFEVYQLDGPMFGQKTCVESIIREQTIPAFAGEAKDNIPFRVLLWSCILQKPPNCPEVKPINWHPRWPKD